MKHSTRKYVLAFLGLTLASSLYARGALDMETNADKTDNSYAYGLIIGTDLKITGLDFDYQAITQGLKDALEERPARFTVDEAIALVQRNYLEENKNREIRFFAENGARSGVLSTESGLQYEVIQSAGGEKPGPQAIVRVHYEGKLSNGLIFDSSYEMGEPNDIPLEQVIPGWSEGVQLMGVGDTYILYIPSELGYGENGAADIIPPYSPLIFTVELLEILQ